jgi:hypothetical protein
MKTVKKKTTKKKASTKAKKSNFCEELAGRTKHYTSSGLAVRKFEWQGTIAVPISEEQNPIQFNRNLGKKSSRPKTEQTVSLNSEGTPDLERIRKQTEQKGSKPLD